MGIFYDVAKFAGGILKDAGTLAKEGGEQIYKNKDKIIEKLKSIFNGGIEKKETGEVAFTPFKVSMVATSGFGKTTLLSCMYQHVSQQLTQVGKMRIDCESEEERRRLKYNLKLMNDAVATGQLHTTVSAALSGTSERKEFEFYMELSHENEKLQIPFTIMDFPGGWIKEGGKAEIKETLNDSRILLVPVDAPVIMSAKTPEEIQASRRVLSVDDVKELVEEWAQHRKAKQDEKALLIFVPVKCEKYLHHKQDNELEKAVKKHFGEVFQTVKNIAPMVEQYYLPVETYGCVEFAYGEWLAEGDAPYLKASYSKVEDSGIIKTKNVDLLVAPILHFASLEIETILENSERVIKEANLFKKIFGKDVKEARKLINMFKKVVEPAIVNLEQHSSNEFDRLSQYRINW